MSLLVNVLKAFGIALVAYFLLAWAAYATLLAVWHLSGHGYVSFHDVGIKDIKDIPADSVCLPQALLPLPMICFGFLFLLAFGALCLPPKGRVYAAVGFAKFIVVVLLWCAMRSFSMMHDAAL